uniref:Uncharacterized protein n=1 Tax=Lepeophtheirus salmonis TaxID=72036 RepID=A0A0K2TIG8_LEPSM
MQCMDILLKFSCISSFANLYLATNISESPSVQT